MSCLVVEVSLEMLTGVNRIDETSSLIRMSRDFPTPLRPVPGNPPCWSTPLDPLWGLWVPTTPLAWCRQIFASCQVSAKLAGRLSWCAGACGLSWWRMGCFVFLWALLAVFQCRWHHVSLRVTVVWYGVWSSSSTCPRLHVRIFHSCASRFLLALTTTAAEGALLSVECLW